MSFMIAPERRRLQAPARPTCLCARSLHQWLRAGPSVLLRRFVRGVPGRYARYLTPSPSERTCHRGSLNRLGVPERLVRAVSPLTRLFTAPSRQTIMVVLELLAVPIEDSLRRSHFRLVHQRFNHISAAAPGDKIELHVRENGTHPNRAMTDVIAHSDLGCITARFWRPKL